MRCREAHHRKTPAQLKMPSGGQLVNLGHADDEYPLSQTFLHDARACTVDRFFEKNAKIIFCYRDDKVLIVDRLLDLSADLTDYRWSTSGSRSSGTSSYPCPFWSVYG